MIDTHTHLYLPEFADGGAEAVGEALAAGVGMMILPNINAESVGPMLALHARYPDCTRIAAGLHPTEHGAEWRASVDAIMERLLPYSPVAVGEIGIDLYWDATHRLAQMDCLEYQLRLASALALPAIIHCREGLAETLEVIASLGADAPECVFHSFTGAPEDVDRIRKVTDATFGINGVATFKNAKGLREALPAIGPHRMVLETDSPYLAPVPYRGKRNQSAYLPATAACVAATLGVGISEVESATDRRACEVFNLPAPQKRNP